LTRGEIWWAELGTFRPLQQTGRRPVIIVQSNALLGVLHRGEVLGPPEANHTFQGKVRGRGHRASSVRTMATRGVTTASSVVAWHPMIELLIEHSEGARAYFVRPRRERATLSR